jgi:hypothetical protein
MSGELDFFSYCALFAFGLYVLAPPALIYFSQRFKANPSLQRFDLDKLPPPGNAGRYLQEMDQQFQSLGFERRAGLTLPDAVPNVKALLVLYANHRSRDMALVAIMYGLNPVDHKVALKSSYVEILSSFKDDDCRALQTNNAQLLGSFPASPGSVTYRFPAVEDMQRLFDLHNQLLERDRPSGRKYIRADEEFGGDDVAYMQAVLRETYDRQIGTGYLSFQPQEQSYRPTVKGALLMTWRELFPVKQILWEGVKAHARRLARELL